MRKLSIVIRPLQAKDEAQWRKLWTGYLEFYETSVAESVYTTTFQRLIDTARPQQVGLVAESEGVLFGLVHFIYHSHNWRLEDVCYLQDLFVAPEARGNGVAHALIEAVYAAADANGTPSVYWLTQEFNANARKLYDRIGQLTPFIKYTR